MPIANPRNPRLWLILAAAVVIILTGVRAYNHEVSGDFARYYTAGKMIANGEHDNLYDEVNVLDRFKHNFRYLPIFAILMSPLSLLPIRIAFWIWKLLHITAYTSGLWFSYKIAREKPHSAKWMILPFLFTVRLFIQNLQLGQINPIVIGLTIAGVFAWARRKQFTAGLLIALGAAIKFTPIVFLLVFIARREWRAIAAILLAGVVLIGVIPSIVLGPGLNIELLRQYFDLEGGLITDTDKENIAGQSLKALTYRFLTPINAVHQWKHNDPIYVNFTEADPNLVYVIYAAGCLLLLGALAWFAHRSRARLDDRRTIALVASITTLVMLLISPESRRAHFMVLVLPFTALTYHAIVPFLTQGRRPIAAILSLLAMGAIAIPSRGMVGREIANLVDAYCNMGLAALLSFAILWSLTNRAIDVDTPPRSG